MEGKGETEAQPSSQAGQPYPAEDPDRAQRADWPNEASAADIVNSMAGPDDGMGEKQEPGGELAPRDGGQASPAGDQPSVSGGWQEPRVRVDARLLEATLLNLRKRISAIPLVYD